MGRNSNPQGEVHDQKASARFADSASGGFRSLLLALRNSEIAVLYQDEKLHYLWVENPPSPWKNASPDLVDREIFSPVDVDRLARAREGVLATGQTARLEVQVHQTEGSRIYDLWLDPDMNGQQKPVGLVTTVVEVTEAKRREQTLRALLREVSHRSKNLLAIIQSIATQTGRYSGTIGDFMTRFRGRLQSLSSSQDLVTSSNWRGTDFRQLVSGQVARYCSDPLQNMRIGGENPYLNPNAALHVGLALHELAVNSVSFGALSLPDGVIEITVSPDGSEGAMTLNWKEHMPAGKAVLGAGHFSSIALERVVPASLNSVASLILAEGTLTYSLVLPADSFHPE